MTKERTLVILKPDAVERCLAGKIIDLLESQGLCIVAMKMVNATSEQLDKHFPASKEWILELGNRAKARFTDDDFCLRFGSDDPYEIGSRIMNGCREYYQSGPLMALVFEGPDAIQTVRDMLGNTLPDKAEPGTIRGDFGDKNQRDEDVYRGVARNLIHASDRDDAPREIHCWFPDLSLERGGIMDTLRSLSVNPTVAQHMFVVAVTCVVLSRDEHQGSLLALIVRRAECEKDGGGLWAIPGGKIDREDWNIQDSHGRSSKLCVGVARRALCRELKEETGISVNASEFDAFSDHEDIVFTRSDGIPGFVLRYFVFLGLMPNIDLDPSLSEYRWISREEIDDYEFFGNIGEDVRGAFKEVKTKVFHA